MQRLTETMPSAEWDRTKWPGVALESLGKAEQEIFQRRKKAIDMYLDGTKHAEIEKLCAIERHEVTRLLRRTQDVDEFGVIAGYRALIPNYRAGRYARYKNVKGMEHRGLAGAFKQLLERYPDLDHLVKNLYLGRRTGKVREPILKIKDIHQRFLSRCKELGISSADYPFFTEDLGYRSLIRYCKYLNTVYFIEAAARNGEEAKRKAHFMFGKPSIQIVRPYERVQFDGHRIDVLIGIRMRTTAGDYVTRIMRRLWLLVVVDVATATILGYHLSLNLEYTKVDVLRCIRNSIMPHKLMEFTVEGLQYPKLQITTGEFKPGGFPADFFPECEWALFDEIAYDNGKANLANVVQERLQNVIGCAIGPGPVNYPEMRGLIERFFENLEERGFHRLVGTTGSGPNDPRRKRAEEDAAKHAITFEELKQLTEALIADYNMSPHRRVSGNCPMEAIRQRVQIRNMVPRQLDDREREEAFLMIKAQRVVRGGVKQGRRPYISYMGVDYRCQVLDASEYLVGSTLTLEVDLDDLRFARAFLTNGAELGTLVADRGWGLTPHNVELRLAILKALRSQQFNVERGEDPVVAFHRYLETAGETERAARNRYAQADQALRGSIEKSEQSRINNNPAYDDEASQDMSNVADRTGLDSGLDLNSRLFTQTLNNRMNG